MSILEGLVKAETTINPTLNSNVDMSAETNTNSTVEKVEVHHHYAPQINLYICDTDTSVKIAETLAQHMRPAVVPPPTT